MDLEFYTLEEASEKLRKSEKEIKHLVAYKKQLARAIKYSGYPFCLSERDYKRLSWEKQRISLKFEDMDCNPSQIVPVDNVKILNVIDKEWIYFHECQDGEDNEDKELIDPFIRSKNGEKIPVEALELIHNFRGKAVFSPNVLTIDDSVEFSPDAAPEKWELQWIFPAEEIERYLKSTATTPLIETQQRSGTMKLFLHRYLSEHPENAQINTIWNYFKCNIDNPLFDLIDIIDVDHHSMRYTDLVTKKEIEYKRNSIAQMISKIRNK